MTLGGRIMHFINLLAQAQGTQQNSSVFWAVLVSWGPSVFACVIYFILIRALFRFVANQKRLVAGMNNMQEKTDEMIQLLKEIRDKQ